MVKYEKHIHGRVPLFGMVADDFRAPQHGDTTRRVVNVIMAHDKGIISDDQHRKIMQNLREEFSDNEPIW